MDRRFGNPKVVGFWLGGIAAPFGVENELLGVFQAGATRSQRLHSSSPIQDVDRSEICRCGDLQPGGVRSEHMNLHVSAHPRGPKELNLALPLSPRSVAQPQLRFLLCLCKT